MWLCIGGGLLTLLVAAIRNKNRDVCTDYQVVLKGARNNLFIDSKDVEQILMKATNSNIKGELVNSFNLHSLESKLKENVWIEDAELYFDNRDVLHISITEKEPVARIFTTEGRSFYIDNSGIKMPLSEKLSAKVPVFTGFPDKKVLSQKDSLLLNDVAKAARFILNDPFWMAQTAQIDITADKKFEMVPVIGNHTVRLGDGENIEAKFRRLMIFYQQVLSKTGMDRYKLIDVQYAGQIVVSRYIGDPKVDSVQWKKSVEKLLNEAIQDNNNPEQKTTPINIGTSPNPRIALPIQRVEVREK
jgi:cell division protein FtsQ